MTLWQQVQDVALMHCWEEPNWNTRRWLCGAAKVTEVDLDYSWADVTCRSCLRLASEQWLTQGSVQSSSPNHPKLRLEELEGKANG